MANIEFSNSKTEISLGIISSKKYIIFLKLNKIFVYSADKFSFLLICKKLL